MRHFAAMKALRPSSTLVVSTLVTTALLTACASEPSTTATEPTAPVTSVATETPTQEPTATAAATAEPTATASATASAPPAAVDPGPLPKDLKILIIGDSFAQALGAGLKRREAAFGGRAVLRGEKATFIPEWAGPNKGVAGMMIQEKPDLVVIALGGNELAMTTPDIRAPKVKELVKLVAGKPCVWVLPPLWGDKKDNGLLKVIKENSAPCRLYDSNVLSPDLPRGSDKIHPTFEGQAKWADEVLEWARKERDTSATGFALKPRPSAE